MFTILFGQRHDDYVLIVQVSPLEFTLFSHSRFKIFFLPANRCLQYMSDYSSCLLQGYGVLPGAPSRVKAPLISDRFAIIEWNPPKILPETVTSYNVHMRKLNSDDEYVVREKDHPPIIIEGLESGSFYEAFVVAVNSHGKGAPSTRLVFPTKRHIETVVEAGELTPSYNITSCCKASGIMPQCMPLCTYDLRVSDLQLLGHTCSLQMGALAKCAAGGRDHTPCCNRRGVIPSCLSLCRGLVPQPPVDCLSYGGNIIQCFEEGTGNIPGPVENLHATLVTKTSISLAWEPNQEDANSTTSSTTANQKTSDIDYVVQYGKVNNMTMYETIVKLENVSWRRSENRTISFSFSPLLSSKGNQHNGHGNRFNEFGKQRFVPNLGLCSRHAWNIAAIVDASDQHY